MRKCSTVIALEYKKSNTGEIELNNFTSIAIFFYVVSDFFFSGIQGEKYVNK